MDPETRRWVVNYPNGWTCEVVLLRLELYVRRTLPRDGALAVAEHLEACPGCVERLLKLDGASASLPVRPSARPPRA
jgi:hypothetical protein